MTPTGSTAVAFLEHDATFDTFHKASALLRQYRLEIIARCGEHAQVEMLIGKGDCAESIVDCVEQHKADALIVGSRGLSAMKRYL
jgi:nucleotide-binding universal stress UspA family protein